YRAFGALTGLTTGSVSTVTGGTRTLTLANTFRSDDAQTLVNWTNTCTTGCPGAGSVAVLKQTLGFTPAHATSQRTDAADIVSSRYYGYDSLLRMTCEARGSGSTQPSSSDCVTTSTRLAGLYTYNDG